MVSASWELFITPVAASISSSLLKQDSSIFGLLFPSHNKQKLGEQDKNKRTTTKTYPIINQTRTLIFCLFCLNSSAGHGTPLLGKNRCNAKELQTRTDRPVNGNWPIWAESGKGRQVRQCVAGHKPENTGSPDTKQSKYQSQFRLSSLNAVQNTA